MIFIVLLNNTFMKCQDLHAISLTLKNSNKINNLRQLQRALIIQFPINSKNPPDICLCFFSLPWIELHLQYILMG